MAEERFDLIFRGDIVLGQPLDQVKQRLQQLFKADPERIERLFSGRPVALKRNLDRPTAEKYRQVLHKAGAQVAITPHRARESASPRPRGLTLAPVGPLLKASERPRLAPVQVDISGLSLRPAQGALLDATERPTPPSTPVAVPDFDIAEPGADLNTGAEREALPLMSIEPEDWGLAEAGSDLLRAQERKPEPPPVEAPGLDLAPVGSDLGPRKREGAPAAPDTRGLRLEDEG